MRDRILVVVVVVAILAIPAFVLYIGREGQKRVDEIQASRIASCRETYRAFPEMFAPFFPADRRKWTAQQRRDWRKLQGRADLLAARCDTQTQPGGSP